MKSTLATRQLGPTKRIALVAHDNKKKDLAEWVEFNRQVLSAHELFSTGTTGTLLQKCVDKPIRKLLSGPLGGDQQIGSMIAAGEIDILIFFWDPMEATPHDSDVKALLRVAIAWNCIVACDRSTADFILTSPLMYDNYAVTIPDYSGTLSGKSIEPPFLPNFVRYAFQLAHTLSACRGPTGSNPPIDGGHFLG